MQAGSPDGSLNYQTTANAGRPIGHYPVLPSGLASGNYVITFVDGTLTVVAAPVVGGPQVMHVQRFGFHMQPTSLAIAQLGPACATDLANYRLVLHGGHRPLRLAYASLSAVGHTVILRPLRLLPLSYHYRLTVVGTPAGD